MVDDIILIYIIHWCYTPQIGVLPINIENQNQYIAIVNHSKQSFVRPKKRTDHTIFNEILNELIHRT